ncbi:SCHIZORIZA, heat shock transcription factor B4 [Hibiscus trionum]|uniref:SCHIZORIZA, heat shock transcription factor B4 n=1 Tax=Hibiscus trionum TaxID=183268 RepID=A0A9W7M4P5_HIBTR|nr:SCHIZORIZA, heat shock transcription factor B4 [Hibiscus trionum]
MAVVLDNCEEISLSLDSHKLVPAPFLTKTYQLLDDSTTDHIVFWVEDDTTFVVWRPPEQLNTYGFRKAVPDRWEFANEFFKKGEKRLLCEIHRRKTPHPQLVDAPSFFSFMSRVSISPVDSDEQSNWCDSPPLSSSPRGATGEVSVVGSYNSSVTALSEDNERLRRSNNLLMSELAHRRKFYIDIIYFAQNHVRHVPPLLLCGTKSLPPPPAVVVNTTNSSLLQKPLNQLLGYRPNTTKPAQVQALTILKEASSDSCKTKLFGLPLRSKKRLHSECGASNIETNNNKARLGLEKEDLGLNLMPPSIC